MAHLWKKRILIVDDEPDPRDLLASCIEYAGFSVVTAVNTIDALDKIKVNIPDLLIINMHMPRHSGNRLIRIFRENKKWVDIPIVIITAHTRNQFGYVEITGFDPFTTRNFPENIRGKTMTPNNLVKTIGEILNVNVDFNDNGVVPPVEHETYIRLMR